MSLNQLGDLGCRLTEIAEPGHLPNFLIVAARRAG
jgi:hypothetical protein